MNSIKYAIYQEIMTKEEREIINSAKNIKDVDKELREKFFRMFNDIFRENNQALVNLDNYTKIYEKTISTENTTKNEVILEELFYIFNMEHPKDYRGRSLSVGDIVYLNEKYYFCASIGWRELIFEPKNKNILKIAS